MLKKSVPPFVARMREMTELFTAEQPELDRMESDLSRLLAQFYVKTADYSLNRWEEDLGLAADPELTLQQRRARVLTKLNSRPPATVRRLENLVRQTMGEDNVWIEEHPEDYSFTVYIQEDQLSDLLGIADQAMHDTRPAHLNYHFIERLIRDCQMQTYAGGYGSLIRMEDVTVDMSRMDSPVYMAGYGQIIKYFREEVEMA